MRLVCSMIMCLAFLLSGALARADDSGLQLTIENIGKKSAKVTVKISSFPDSREISKELPGKTGGTAGKVSFSKHETACSKHEGSVFMGWEVYIQVVGRPECHYMLDKTCKIDGGVGSCAKTSSCGACCQQWVINSDSL